MKLFLCLFVLTVALWSAEAHWARKLARAYRTKVRMEARREETEREQRALFGEDEEKIRPTEEKENDEIVENASKGNADEEVIEDTEEQVEIEKEVDVEGSAEEKNVVDEVFKPQEKKWRRRMNKVRKLNQKRRQQGRPLKQQNVGCDHHDSCTPRPRYRVMQWYRGYELRCYPEYYYASTMDQTLDGKCFHSMFQRLFAYINGSNSRNTKMEMTAPVFIPMAYNISNHKTRMGMFLWLTPPHHGPCGDGVECPSRGPPKPTDPKVWVRKTPMYCAYVREFDGYIMSRSNDYYRQLYYLTQDLGRDGNDKSYYPGFSMLLNYNPPWQLFDRRTEVMRVYKCSKCDNTDYNSYMASVMNELSEQEAKKQTMSGDGQ